MTGEIEVGAHNPDFNEEHIPLAYLITFRCYGTWLHGDERGSTDRHHHQYGTPFIPPNQGWHRYNQHLLKHPPVELDAARRKAVESALCETCDQRHWLLRAVNVRTNHVHSVVTAPCWPEPILAAFKANATRHLREAGCWRDKHSPWADKGSRRYLWTPRGIERAIDYVVNGQGGELPDFDADEEFPLA